VAASSAWARVVACDRRKELGAARADRKLRRVGELLAEGDGDVLVFLSGEREIRDTKEVLDGRLGQKVEVLPLFSRLSVAEQQKAFRGGPAAGAPGRPVAWRTRRSVPS